MRTGNENNVNYYKGPNLSMRFDNIPYFTDISHKIWNLEACTFVIPGNFRIGLKPTKYP
jgi:hypothetical protein